MVNFLERLGLRLRLGAKLVIEMLIQVGFTTDTVIVCKGFDMKHILLATAAMLAATSAQAATLYSNPLLTGAIASPGAVSFTAISPVGQSGALSFNLDGFKTLDGLNFYEDDFTLKLNGTSILSLSYNLGGGGANQIFTNTYGATVTGGDPNPNNIGGNGGQLQISLAGLPLTSGSNTFSFSYDSPSGDALGGTGGHAGPQGTGDEAWGVSSVLLSAESAVPEPASWALMLVGFGMAGAALRRRPNVAVQFS